MKSNEAELHFLRIRKTGSGKLGFDGFVYLASRQKFHSWEPAGDSLLDGETGDPHAGYGLRREGFLKSRKGFRWNLDGKEISVRRGKNKTFNVGMSDSIGQFESHIVWLEGVILRGKLLEGAIDNVLSHPGGNSRNPLRHARKIPMAIAGRSLRHSPRDTFDKK
jgi:hypothetical protein